MLKSVSVGVDVVAKVVGDDVPMYKLPPTVRKVHGLLVLEPSVSASCGAVELEMVSAYAGVVVPIPMLPKAPTRSASTEEP